MKSSSAWFGVYHLHEYLQYQKPKFFNLSFELHTQLACAGDSRCRRAGSDSVLSPQGATREQQIPCWSNEHCHLVLVVEEPIRVNRRDGPGCTRLNLSLRVRHGGSWPSSPQRRLYDFTRRFLRMPPSTAWVWGSKRRAVGCMSELVLEHSTATRTLSSDGDTGYTRLLDRDVNCDVA